MNELEEPYIPMKASKINDLESNSNKPLEYELQMGCFYDVPFNLHSLNQEVIDINKRLWVAMVH